MEPEKKEEQPADTPEEEDRPETPAEEDPQSGTNTEERGEAALEAIPEEKTGPENPEEDDGPRDLPTQMFTGMTHDEKTFFLSMAGLSTFVRSTNRLFWTNFLMGLARGIGFVIGMSIVGAVVVGLWNEMISVTGIGKFIARILEEVHQSKP